jgi:chromosome partitioning protein
MLLKSVVFCQNIKLAYAIDTKLGQEMGYVIASVNMKGGVGKTTLTVNIATCLAKVHRKRVLVVDLDTQISATLSMISPAEFAKLRKEKLTLRQLVRQSIHPVDRKFAIQNIIQPHVCKVQGLGFIARGHRSLR